MFSFEGFPESGKTEAVQHLVQEHSVTFQTMIKEIERPTVEGISYYELAAYELQKLVIKEVTRESCNMFGMCSAFKTELLAKK